jgi:hypothetical protein
LHARYPEDFRTSADSILCWHQREAVESEQAGQWFATLFHLDRVLELKPDEPSLPQRRAHAREQLKQARFTGEAIKSPVANSEPN